MRIVISSGHGKYVRGAVGLIDEVDEARKVVPRVAEYLRERGHQVDEFNDDTSTTQDENLATIVNYHNAQTRDLDVSVHFNCYVATAGARGTEVLYVTQDELAAKVSDAIACAGDLIDRGAHKRTDLYFLNKTNKPSILIELCFVDAGQDVKHYQMHFDDICQAIAAVSKPAAEPEPPEVAEAVRFAGTCSWFGGPMDKGVSPDEGLAFFYKYGDAPHLFLPAQPKNTTGLARRLDPTTNYIACRWNYDVTPKSMLADKTIMALVRRGDIECLAYPADWGPHESTGRIADISPGLMDSLGIETDDEIEIVYPAPHEFDC
jgi:N-acetylmuramoyl-L-alanine amidase